MNIFSILFPWWSLATLVLVFGVACIVFLKGWRSRWTVITIASVISAALFCYGFYGAADFYAYTGVMRWLYIGLGVVLGPFYIVGGVRFVCAPKLRKG